MKNKYLGLVAVCVALVSLVISALLLTLMTFHPTPVMTERAQSVQALSSAEERLVASLTDLQEALPRLFGPALVDSGSGVVYAGLFPSRSRTTSTNPVLRNFEVQMIYRVGDDAVALIDNGLYRVGDQLPGGARVLSIGSDSVVVFEASQRREIPVRRSNQGRDGGSL